ncbi:MAG: M81 family metallopeptidase [Candidatus Latescibacterota bacterium]
MRIAIAGFNHESNTFASHPTSLEDFRIYVGHQVLEHYAGTFHEVSGCIAGAEEYGYEMVPILEAGATPGGTVRRHAYEEITGRILHGLRVAHLEEPLDGVLLALHGAMVCEDYPQADAQTVLRVRQAMGPDFPIVVTHDYHANVPQELVEGATALVIYKTNPHVDQRERGLQAASILARTVRGQVRPAMALAKPELLFNIYFHNTSRPPMQPLMQAAIDLESDPGILACSIAAGYQYADVPAMGPSVVVVTDNDPGRARREADALAERMWQGREQLLVDIPGPATAVAQALSSPHFPVTLLDFGDNVGGGSAGDSTFILEQLVAQQARGWVVTLYDPEAAAACAAAGIGARVRMRVGGKTDAMHGPTLEVEGRVRTLHDGTYEETERRHGGGRHFDQGLSAVLAVEDARQERAGLLLLTTRRAMPMSIHQITCAGIQPQQQRILVAKGAVAPRAAYEPVSARLIEVDSGGATAIRRPAAEFRRARRTLYEWRG